MLVLASIRNFPAVLTIACLVTSSALLRAHTITCFASEFHSADIVGVSSHLVSQMAFRPHPNVSFAACTIGVEMVANPSVIFMDEPTSGLDARAAVIVMQAVKNVSRNGRTVMVTIHQPSIEIFETFDALVLLQAGGRVRSHFPVC